jgi:hypothetical protein
MQGEIPVIVPKLQELRLCVLCGLRERSQYSWIEASGARNYHIQYLYVNTTLLSDLKIGKIFVKFMTF